jgi:hypothetical protein
MWRAEDREFAAAWDDAFEAGTDRLADIATERGITESDALLIFMLKCRDPQRFNQRQVVSIGGDENAPPITLAGQMQPYGPIIILPHNSRGEIPPHQRPPPGYIPPPREIEATAELPSDETIEPGPDSEDAA